MGPIVGSPLVEASSGLVTFREVALALTDQGAVTDEWLVIHLPRQMLWTLQTTNNGGSVALIVQFAIRESATPGTPEWLDFTIPLALNPGIPLVTPLVTGAVWLRFRFTLAGSAGETVSIAATAFV